MSGRYSDMFAFAYDANNNRYPVVTQYAYSSGCGCYHYMVQVKDQLFDVETYIEDEQPKTTGTYLPFLYPNDFESYFSDSSTEAMKTILHEAELDGINIDHFLLIEVKSVNAGPYSATCCRISQEEIISREYDLCENELAYSCNGDNEIEAIVSTLIGKVEADGSYWSTEQTRYHKYAETVTYALTSDNYVYVVFKEASYTDDDGNHLYRASFGNKCHQVFECAYNEFPEEDDYEIPYAFVIDYESYFSPDPSGAIKTLLAAANLADVNIKCFVMVDTNRNQDGIITAIRHRISSESTEVRECSIENFDDNIELVLKAI